MNVRKWNFQTKSQNNAQKQIKIKLSMKTITTMNKTNMKK